MFQNWSEPSMKNPTTFLRADFLLCFLEPDCCDESLEVPHERIGASTLAAWHVHDVLAIWSSLEWLGNLNCWFPVGFSHHYFVEIFALLKSDDLLDCCWALTFEHRTKTEKTSQLPKRTLRKCSHSLMNTHPKLQSIQMQMTSSIYIHRLQKQPTYPVKLQKH